MTLTDVLYLGRHPECACELSNREHGEVAVQLTSSIDVAEKKLARARFDCLVVDRELFETMNDRMLDATRKVPIIVRCPEQTTVAEDDPPMTDLMNADNHVRVIADEAELHSAIDRLTSNDAHLTSDLESGDVPDNFGTLLTESTQTDGWALTIETDGAILSFRELGSGSTVSVEGNHTLGKLMGPTEAARHLKRGEEALLTDRTQTVTGQWNGRLYHTLVRPVGRSQVELVVKEFGQFDGSGPFTPESSFVDVVLDNLLDIFFVFDLDLNFTFWNERFPTVTGFDPEQIATSTPFRFIAEEDHEHLVEKLGDIVSTGQGVAELDIVTQDGERIPYSFTASLIRSEDGSPLYICGIGRDITERRTREESLRESERALSQERDLIEHILESIPIAICVLDDSGRITRANQRAKTLVGGDAETVHDIRCRVPDSLDGTAEENPVYHLLETDEPIRGVEFPFTGADEIERWISANGVPLELPDVDETRIIALEDVTELKERQQELEDRREDLERSNADLEQYAYAVSHDLKEPLRMISSYLQMIDRRYADDLDEDGREFIEYAVDGSERLRRRIRALLQYSQIDQGDVEQASVDCEEIVDSVRENLSIAIEEAGADVVVGDLPRVTGDRGQLEKLFQNLISNAIKYSGENPEIRIAAEPCENADGWILSVSDDGDGIPEERQDRVFDLFYTSSDDNSTGIGLAICEKIVTRHGGDISVESTPGCGTTFSFTLASAESEQRPTQPSLRR